MSSKNVTKNVMTVRQFARSLGLKKTGADYIGATILLKVLVKQGVVKKVGAKQTGKRGRKSVLYNVPTSLRLSRKAG